MALMQCNFHSDVLGRACTMNVILPQKSQTQIGMGSSEASAGGIPVLYLLHGCSDDHSIWLRRTSIERYVAELGIAVVMPNADRSFYTDMAHGYRYWSFVSEELPSIVEGFFHVSSKREDTFVAGLSMGGYGALKMALRRPDKFCFGGSLSGVTDIVDWYDKKWDKLEAEITFGSKEQLEGSDDDLFALADKALKNGQPLPKLVQICGTEDFLYDENQKFRSHMESLKEYDYSYFEAPGVHCWEFWDQHIQRILNMLPLHKG